MNEIVKAQEKPNVKQDSPKQSLDQEEAPSAQGLTQPRRPGGLRNVLISVLIIAAGITAAAYINHTAPKARKRPPEKARPLVQVEALSPGSHRVVVEAMGTVIPAREIVLKSQVSGEILAAHPRFTEGGLLEEGSVLLKIDPEDYELALAKKQSAVTNAEYALKLEQGHQDVAKREWDLFNGEKTDDERDMELALRKPHLAKAKADLAAAMADLEQAKLDLARTSIRAPFNCIVRTKNVDLGSRVSTQDTLAELVGTDEYWIQASVPVDRLEWMTIPRSPGQTGSTARVFYRNGHERAGTVIRLLGDLETEGRMARILVEVRDPLDLRGTGKSRPPLLIGEYVRSHIQGRELQNVFRVPRSALRDNTSLWIASKDGKLEIRSVQTLWRDAQTVLLREGIQPGDQLIVSELATPIDGMPLQVAE
jgi:RND family efflux transporter MFP subunit